VPLHLGMLIHLVSFPNVPGSGVSGVQYVKSFT
jgi:hypothetical protein